jgi:hypothetical protein
MFVHMRIARPRRMGRDSVEGCESAAARETGTRRDSLILTGKDTAYCGAGKLAGSF